MDIEELHKKTLEIKKLILDSFEECHCGHIASSYSCAEILVSLYYGGLLRYNPKEPKWEGRDRFILSKGHAALILYTILADVGFFDKTELFKLGKNDGKAGVHGHITLPGVEINTGSLASGFGVAAGMALAAKKSLRNHMIFALLGDGECYEGAIWETAAFASGYGLNNLITIIDHNHMCCSGFIEDNLSFEPLGRKWEAFGFDVCYADGHDIRSLLAVFERIRCRKSNKPLCLIADTVKAHGLKSVENTPLCHGYAPLKSEAIKDARRELLEGR